jgi:hypothetical protein
VASVDLGGLGIENGATCWVGGNIVAGEQNHESGDNFTYADNGGWAVYNITGATWTPSWSLVGT